jgi:uncharacterized protein YdaU (DUF1376 family)
MSKAPAMPYFGDAFVADTMHLTTEEIGAYWLLLTAMWRHNGFVPDDDKDLSRITRTGKKWKRIKARLAPMLTFVEGNITQKRLQKEWAYVTALGQKQSENAKARWNKTNNLGDATGYAKNQSGICPHTHTQVTKTEKVTKSKPPAPRSARDELLAVLDVEHAEAVIDHRKTKRSPQTADSAKQHAKALAEARNPNRAADVMIAQGWQGFRLSWLENLDQRGIGPPRGATRQEQLQQAITEHLEEIDSAAISDTGFSRRAICGTSSERHPQELYASSGRSEGDAPIIDAYADWISKGDPVEDA